MPRNIRWYNTSGSGITTWSKTHRLNDQGMSLVCGKSYQPTYRIETVKEEEYPECQKCCARIPAIAQKREAAEERRKRELNEWRESLTPAEFVGILATHFKQFSETVQWDDCNSPGRIKISTVHYIHNGVVLCNKETPGGDVSVYCNMRRATCRQCHMELRKQEISAACNIERAFSLCLKRCGLPQYQLEVVESFYRVNGAGKAISIVNDYLKGN